MTSTEPFGAPSAGLAMYPRMVPCWFLWDEDAFYESGRAVIDRSQTVSLAPETPFDSIYQAKAVLKYKPRAFAPVPEDDRMSVMTITRNEEAWCSKLVHVREQNWTFLKDRPVEPEICYQVEPIDYQWNRARLV